MSNIDYSDPNNTPPIGQAVPLGLQHVLAMFASNVTPSIIVAGAAGLAFGGVENANWFQLPAVMPYGFEFSLGAVIGVSLVSLVSAIETIGDTSATTKAGSERDATDAEISGATYADGLGTAVAGVFGGLPNTSFSQNVGIVGMTGIMSRHVVTIAGIIMIICGLIPKIGAVISSMPLPVLGGGVIVMFGMVAAAGMNMLSTVSMNRRNMIIISVSLAVGLGLNLVPSAVQHLPGIWKTLATSAVAPTALLAVIMNLVLPEDD